MGIVDVVDVSLRPHSSELLHGFNLESPQPNDSSDTYALTFQGWLVPRDAPALGLRLQSPGRGLRSVRLNLEREDVASKYPDVPWARMSGFRSSLGVARLQQEFEVVLILELEDRDPWYLGRVRGRRRALPAVAETRFQPILMTSLPRSGGTWTTHLLSRHPEVLALRPFQYEARIATYWMDVFVGLAEPRSFLQTLSAEMVGEHWWLGDNNLAPEAPTAPDPEFTHWLARDNVEDILHIFQGRVEAAYSRIAQIQGRDQARFFMEGASSPTARAMLLEIYPGSREIVLVRDLRDTVASIFAYNRKRGFQFFGRDVASSDSDYIAQFAKMADNVVQTWREHADSSFLLKYEELVREPERTLRSVLNYLGIASNADVIKTMLNDAESSVRHGQDAHRTTPTVQASIGRWQKDLEPELQKACNEALGDALATLGYA